MWGFQSSVTPYQLNGVWGTDASNVWAVGQSGTIVRWNGTAWAAQQSGTMNTLSAV